MLCLMSLYYGIFVFMAFSLQFLLFVLPWLSPGFIRVRVIWWPIYCFLSEFVLSPAPKQYGKVLFDIRYDRFVFVPFPNSFTQLSGTHMMIIEFCIWLGLGGGSFWGYVTGKWFLNWSSVLKMFLNLTNWVERDSSLVKGYFEVMSRESKFLN